MGQVVVRRGVPCAPTEAGAVLLRMARQAQVLDAETRRALGDGASARTMTPVAVNADSPAIWSVPVLREAAGWADTTLDLHVEDENHSSRLLRQGDVLGAVTSDPTPVGGCRVERPGFLRHLRHVPVAAPAPRRRFTTEAGVDRAAMPVPEFNAKDDLQRRALRSEASTSHRPRVPSRPPKGSSRPCGPAWGGARPWGPSRARTSSTGRRSCSGTTPITTWLSTGRPGRWTRSGCTASPRPSARPAGQTTAPSRP
ncbi:hypothetical protein [Streptomyces macrosporus]|uniref:LysR family transcriptional regulator n=1 Tax=Streptomyces macrosporus TaxID=44032 RepID=A0ABN3JST4_9ACTN